MSVRLYDDAIVTKIKKWIKDESLKVLSPDETERLFQIKADETKDSPITLPLITITRNPEIELQYAHKKVMSYDGMMLDSTYEKSLQIDAIPMTISYQIDIYTRYFNEGDEYLRNFVFQLINFPTVKVILPYNNIQYEHWSNIKLLPTLEDTSDIPLRLAPDQFTRWTIRFEVDDAYFFSLPYKNNVSIDEENSNIELKD